MRGWQPNIDADGVASKYEEVLRGKLVHEGNMEVESIDKLMYEAATSPGVSVQVAVHSKPWQSEELQDLIRKRHLCTTSGERTSISKLIQKVSRKVLRKHQTEAASKLLETFSGLSDLPKVQETY